MMKNSSLSDGGDQILTDEILTSVKWHNECSNAAEFKGLAAIISAAIGADLKDI